MALTIGTFECLPLDSSPAHRLRWAWAVSLTACRGVCFLCSFRLLLASSSYR
ncbi:hypothetical protein BDV39DRAFT_177324 [Aspergillus sergii]|uniref:Uncharacterized protein n=1 Tax=Aspergillus sergii TaxID=1034303 RepID=A0A5N6X270_9EURO|nr:hypothetical protein BDV39DRAFT_177324 [Aspergillus sergii]